MKLDSVYFNMLRAQPKGNKNKNKAAQQQIADDCGMPGCSNRGRHRAPNPKGSTTRWKFFCAEHITEYNRTYNYFAHMSEAEIAAFQKSAATGHRPTWQLGARGPQRQSPENISDYFNLFRNANNQARPRKPKVLARKAKALEVLGLNESAEPKQIRMRFKQLVKRYHPDLNGSERKYEHRLSAVIQSYNELKKGF